MMVDINLQNVNRGALPNGFWKSQKPLYSDFETRNWITICLQNTL